MSHRTSARLFVSLILLPLLLLSGCWKSSQTVATVPKNAIPPDKLNAVLAAHLQGLGHMERYEYRDAAKKFSEIRELAPDWLPGSINLAIALLNDVGAASVAAKTKGNYTGPITLLDDVLAREPENRHALFCRGLILQDNGRLPEANAAFKKVTELDPKDAHAWYRYGATLSSRTDSDRSAATDNADRLIEIYTKSLDQSPALSSALYGLAMANAYYRVQLLNEFSKLPPEQQTPERKEKLAKTQRELSQKQLSMLAHWKRLSPQNDPAGPGDTSENFYGEAGKYATIISPFPSPLPPASTVLAPMFEALTPMKVTFPEGTRWVKPDDFAGPLAVIGRARARFGATIVTFDADGDGRTDVFLAAGVKGPRGVRDALLLNRSEGSFEDVSAAWGLPEDRASLGAAASDFDADRRIDLVLTSLDDNHLLRNLAGSKFEDVTTKAGLTGSKALALTARWMDIDQDGDLDLYFVNYTERASAGEAFKGDASPLPKVSNTAYRNDGTPSGPPNGVRQNWAPLAVSFPDQNPVGGLSIAMTLWPKADALFGPPGHYSAVAFLFLDNDRDIDLILTSDGEPTQAVLNDRLGAFHAIRLKELESAGTVSGLIVTDFDKDRRADLAILRPNGRVTCWRNTTDESTPTDTITWETWPTDAKMWVAGTAADLDLDTWPDLVNLPTKGELPAINWSRNEGKRLADRPLVLVDLAPPTGFALVDLVGDALPDLLILNDDAPPRVAKNLGNGEHWLGLEIGGKWKVGHEHMRTNPHGIGTRIALEGQGLHVTYDHMTPSCGLGQSIGSIVLGLGKNVSADLVRFSWPDGTMQCELNKGADAKLLISEMNRKTGSCPVLFTWNGTRFVCLGDFLGGGGMGYLVAPGVYGQPDPDESVAIAADQLAAEKGVFRLVVTEPMDEVAYLDQLRLEVVDRPPGVTVGLDERFAPEGPRPTGELLAWKTHVDPVSATDLKEQDVTKTLRDWDRDTVDRFRLLDDWIGYAENHGIVLDFGDRLSKFSSETPLLLALAGWVEYPYSQTNYAASTAGVPLRPPTIERLQDDGTWKSIESHAGYPAGLPRMTTLDLTGKLNGPRCVIRLQTNMECYWDQAFVAVRDKSAEASLKRSMLPVARAVLEHRGYTREVSPDGRLPLLYDYKYVDPAPLAQMGGRLTRLGDVAALLQNVDDQLCVVGPGDETRLEFDATHLPALPEGWTRSYVLKSYGYCKDADPLTAGSDTVEPLPWRGMPPFPFGTEAQRPSDEAYRAYLQQYQSRPAGVRTRK